MLFAATVRVSHGPRACPPNPTGSPETCAFRREVTKQPGGAAPGQAMDLVYSTIQRMRAEYSEALVTEALATGEAVRMLRQSVRR